MALQRVRKMVKPLWGGAKPLCSGPARLFRGADFLYPLP